MSDPNLQDQFARLVSGYWYTQAIYVATRLGIAELLKDGPKAAQVLAPVTGTNPRALYRLLRALASIGIFAEEQGQFSLTPLAECLLDPSTKAMATMRGDCLRNVCSILPRKQWRRCVGISSIVPGASCYTAFKPASQPSRRSTANPFSIFCPRTWNPAPAWRSDVCSSD